MPARLEKVALDPATPEGWQPVGLTTSHGLVHGRYTGVFETDKAVVMVGDASGGFGSPALGLYDRLARELPGLGIATLHIRFRQSTNLEESVHDVLAGLLFLQERGIVSNALVGHAFGGAVVIRAAATSPSVHGVVSLATQTYGTAYAARLGDRCPVLLIHGLNDEVLPPAASATVYDLIPEAKELELVENAGHGLDEAAQDVYERLIAWLPQRLGAV